MGRPGEAELAPASTMLILATALTLPWVLAVVLSTSGGSVVKNLPAKQEMRVQSLGWEDVLEKEMARHSSILAWNPMVRASLVGYSPWGCKSDTT